MPENRARFRADLDDNVSPKLTGIRKNFEGIKKSTGFKALAEGVGLGAGVAAFNLLGTAISGAISFMGDSIQAASDLNEQVSKSRVVFAAASSDVEEFAGTAAKSLGISKVAAIEAAGSFGNFFTNIGKSKQEAAAMSIRMVKLAGDLASFNNIGTDEALEKIRSGLSGEAEPLRQVGVFLTEAKVKTKAMQLGLADAHGELSEGAKILARYQLILDETTNAQGDFARTSDSVANQQRILNAEIKDNEAKLGGLFQILEQHVLRVLVSAGDVITDLADGFDDTDKNLRKLNQGMREDRTAASDMKAALAGPVDSLKTFAERAREARAANEKYKESLADTADTLIEKYYDPIRARDQLAASEAEERAARRVLASKKSTTAEIRDARATVHAADEEQDKLRVSLLESGALTTRETEDWIKEIKERIRKSKGPAKIYLQELIKKIEELRLASQAQFPLRFRALFGTGPPSKSGTAVGGYRPPGWTGTAGEEGTETYHALPGGGVYITPHGMTGGGGSAESVVVHTTIQLDGRVLAEVVDRHNYHQLQRAAPTQLRA